MSRKQKIIRILTLTAWILVGGAVLVLLGAAIKGNGERRCTGVSIQIRGVNNHFFVDRNDVLNEVNDYMDGGPTGHPLNQFNLRAMESELEKNIWVRKIQMYFDNNAVLQIQVLEREPVARVFTTGGDSYYIDSSLQILPLSEKFSARLPVFTDFPSDRRVLSKADSALLRDVCNISLAIQQDPFRMGFIEQVSITPQRRFELIPKMGDAVIRFGTGQEIEEKFNKLKLFYKNIVTRAGWNYYSIVNLQFNGQVVAKRRDAADFTADSSNVADIMRQMAAIAEKQANDSMPVIQTDNETNTTNPALIMQSMERPEEQDGSFTSEEPKPQGIPVLTVRPQTVVPVTNPPTQMNVPPAKSVPGPMKKTESGSAAAKTNPAARAGAPPPKSPPSKQAPARTASRPVRQAANDY